MAEHTASTAHIHPSADISPDAHIGAGAHIWHGVQVRENCHIGEKAIIGRGVYIGPGVKVGKESKIQNYALVYEPADIADGVFIGPNVTLTNDTYPRAINADGTQKTGHDWESVGVTIHYGASIGAGSICVAPATIGQWAMVAAGSVVVKDVTAHALVAGVPAKQIGWVGKNGQKLHKNAHGRWESQTSGEEYEEQGGNLKEYTG